MHTGDRVGIAWLRHTCGQCRFCTAGRENLCPYSQYTGYHADGGYAEYAIAPEDFVYEIPEQFDDAHASPLLCAGIIGYRALLRSNVREGERLAIFGFGSSAHVITQIARRRGCEVYVVSRGKSHQGLAKELGTPFVGSPLAPGKEAVAIKPARIALWDKFGGSMTSGWTRWLLEKFEYSFTVVTADVPAPREPAGLQVTVPDKPTTGAEQPHPGAGIVRRNVV